jgi:hypothetical protein
VNMLREYCNKTEAAGYINTTLQRLNSEYGQYMYDTPALIKWPGVRHAMVLSFPGVAFRIENVGRCRYNVRITQ